jgi:hypothetical protein
MRSGAFRVLILSVFAGVSGCAMMGSMSNYWKKTFSFSKGTDYINGADEKDEAWVTEAAEEARGDRPREKEPDPLGINHLFESEKARSINRNLGFD